MKKDKGLKAWRFSGEYSRYIDRFLKEDELLRQKARQRTRENLDVDKAVEKLLDIIEQ